MRHRRKLPSPRRQEKGSGRIKESLLAIDCDEEWFEERGLCVSARELVPKDFLCPLPSSTCEGIHDSVEGTTWLFLVWLNLGWEALAIVSGF